MAARVVVSIALVLSPHPLTDPTGVASGPRIADGVSDKPGGVVVPVDALPQPRHWTDEALPLQVITPPTTTLPPPTSSTEPVAAVRPAAALVDEIFGWPGRTLVTCESNWDRFAVGAAGERGLFQIHPVHRTRIAAMGFTWDDMFEVEPNIRVATEIRRVQGLGAWTCWKGAA